MKKVSIACKESAIPVWNHAYCFSLDDDKEILFKNTGALVLEFYLFISSNYVMIFNQILYY